MPFQYQLSEKLKEIAAKLVKRDPTRAEILYKKINQITNSDENTIEHFKNLRHDFSDRKRVHIDRNFVLTFRVFKEKNFILFLDFDHHDNIYKR